MDGRAAGAQNEAAIHSHEGASAKERKVVVYRSQRLLLALTIVVAGLLLALFIPGAPLNGSTQAHSGADQEGINTSCGTSLGPFIRARVTGYNQNGSYVTWDWSFSARCSVVTSNWWWQNERGVTVKLTHQDGHVSCHKWTKGDNPLDIFSKTVWVTQKYDDHC